MFIFRDILIFIVAPKKVLLENVKTNGIFFIFSLEILCTFLRKINLIFFYVCIQIGGYNLRPRSVKEISVPAKRSRRFLSETKKPSPSKKPAKRGRRCLSEWAKSPPILGKVNEKKSSNDEAGEVDSEIEEFFAQKAKPRDVVKRPAASQNRLFATLAAAEDAASEVVVESAPKEAKRMEEKPESGKN